MNLLSHLDLFFARALPGVDFIRHLTDPREYGIASFGNISGIDPDPAIGDMGYGAGFAQTNGNSIVFGNVGQKAAFTASYIWRLMDQCDSTSKQ